MAQDPGGAEVIAPALVALKKCHKDDYDLEVIARGEAVRVFESSGISFSRFEGDSHQKKWSQYAEQILHQKRYDIVFTATSSVPSPERLFIRASKKLGLPSISILDSWTNYRDRFLEPGETQLCDGYLPSYIGVANQFGLAEMEALGFPPHILRVVGHPGINEFLRRAKGQQEEAQNHIRRTLNLDGKISIVVFFSQPIEVYNQMRAPSSDPGYSETDVLNGLMQAILRLPERVILLVKPHPKEPIENFFHIKVPNVYVVNHIDPDWLAMAADAVVSMTSGMLVKAFLHGKPVLSIQPNLHGYDQSVLSRAGCITTIRDAGRLVDCLVEALSGSTSPPSHDFDWDLKDGQEIERILNLIKEFDKDSG
ncbi:MAG: hypothetical protein O2999_04935 [Nitrospirae bacterium]|nr:hypothetical protein [Nitrospirota bacterium]